MTERQFDHGYWYANELKSFARKLGIRRPSAMRKDQLEASIKSYLRTGRLRAEPGPAISVRNMAKRDFELGLRADLAVTRYTSNEVTKAFILAEARKVQPDFVQKSGTRYLLNRWREEQLATGRKLTYGDLARQALALNRTKSGPLRLEHGRYINFISDFLRDDPGARHREAVRAWHQVKKSNGPKTFAAWKKHRRALRRATR
jgi:hypothetical protein